MRALKNSEDSPRSSFGEVLLSACLLSALAVAAATYFSQHGYILYYGDAQAHLNISRSWIDSRTPGYDQIGTVWLPLLHFICLPLAGRDAWWRNGVAGTVPVAACFVAAGVSLYLCGKEIYRTSAAATAGVLCFALNPNVLYLASIPMTELVFAAGLLVCLLAVLRFRRTQQTRYLALALVASWWMSLTRYDGWFLIPFITFFLAASTEIGKLRVLLAVGTLAALPPVYWLAHCWWETGNALDFYNGPYSAAAIQQYKPYPGLHNWPQAFQYYWEAGRACCGDGLAVVGIAGSLTALVRGRWLAVLFLALTPLFYVLSVHGSWTPIHLPWLWPNGYYNTRYGLAVVVLMGFAAGALIPRSYPRSVWVVALVALLPWLVKPGPDGWICWKESEHNSAARRAWTGRAAAFFRDSYRTGDGVLTEFGDMAGVFGAAGIPLKETLHEGNGLWWMVNTMPSGILRQTKWAMAQQDDKLWKLFEANHAYRPVYEIVTKGAPKLIIYERNR